MRRKTGRQWPWAPRRATSCSPATMSSHIAIGTSTVTRRFLPSTLTSRAWGAASAWRIRPRTALMRSCRSGPRWTLPLDSSRGRAGSRASTGATSCAWRRTPPPNSSMRKWPMRWRSDLLRKSRWQPSRSRRPFERHAVPLALQQLDSPPSDSFPMPAIEVVGTEFLIRGLARQDMIRGDQHGVGDREDGLLVTAVAHDAAVAGRERTVGRPNRRQRGFGERSPQPAIAAPSLPRLVFPGAFVVPGTEAGPAGQVAVTGELTHVHSELGDQHLGGAPGDAVNGIQAGQFIA